MKNTSLVLEKRKGDHTLVAFALRDAGGMESATVSIILFFEAVGQRVPCP